MTCPRKIRQERRPRRPRGINHLVLNVRNLEVSHRFWTEIIGFRCVPSSSRYGAQAAQDAFLQRPRRRGPRDPSRPRLAEVQEPEANGGTAKSGTSCPAGPGSTTWPSPGRTARRGSSSSSSWQSKGVPFHRRTNHGMTHSVYISDPDGHGIEVLYELPREVWEHDIDAPRTTRSSFPPRARRRWWTGRTTPSSRNRRRPWPAGAEARHAVLARVTRAPATQGGAMAMPVGRRAFLRGATASAVGVDRVPSLLRASPARIKVGMVSPARARWRRSARTPSSGRRWPRRHHAAGGIKSMGGARLELLQRRQRDQADVARSEAERSSTPAAQLLTGGYHSAHVASIAALASSVACPTSLTSRPPTPHRQHRQVRPRGAAEAAVRDRIFPGSVIFGRNAVRYNDRDLSRGGRQPQAGGGPVLQHLFGKTQNGELPGRPQGGQPGFEIVDVIPLSGERRRPRHGGVRGPAPPSPTSSRR